MLRPVACLSIAGLLIMLGCQDQTAAQDMGKAEGGTIKKVIKSDREWQKILPRESFLVTRMKATEPAGTGKYANYHGSGIFACICCGTELFNAKTKFESGTGWPSFYKPIAENRIHTEQDFSLGEVRTEVTCAVCDAHLGHVFGDGPPPTGLRFCMNSAALTLVKPPAPIPKAKAKTAVKTKDAKATDAKPKDTPKSDPVPKDEAKPKP